MFVTEIGVRKNQCFGLDPHIETKGTDDRRSGSVPSRRIKLQPCPDGDCMSRESCGSVGFPVTNSDSMFDAKLSQRPDPQVKDPQTAKNGASKMCKGPKEICCKLYEPDYDTEGEFLPLIPLGCGYQLPTETFESHETVNGQSRYGEFPWMIVILQKIPGTADTFQYMAGGSLIHPSVVLTLTHAVLNKPADQLNIRAGEWDTQSSDELYPHQDRSVSRIKLHDHFNRLTMANSIALLFLDRAFDLGQGVNTVCLPPPNVLPDASVRCFATGWGRDKLGRGGRYQTIMRKIDLPIVEHRDCQRRLQATRLGRRFQLHGSLLCAGGEGGRDTCRGDGGSPLVCQIPNGSVGRYYQAGIVAGGIGCGNTAPSVYVNVGRFTNWIIQQMYYVGIQVDNTDLLNFNDFYDDFGR